MASRAVRRSTPDIASLAPQVCLEMEDHGLLRHSASVLFGLRGLRDPRVAAARMAEQFIHQNRAILSVLGVEMRQEYDGRDVMLALRAGNEIGAVPLLSPTSARPDYGLVVQPRFPWPGIGPMLGDMGWRVSPAPLKLPLLRRSERRVPVWVLSLMILVRLKCLLDRMERRFEMTNEIRSTPRGTVDWGIYATRHVANGRALSIPCSYPDLRDDRLLKGAIRHTLEKQLRALETQKGQGAFAHRLIEMAQELLRKVAGVAAYVPSPTQLSSWMQRPLRSAHLTDGIQAMEWTIEDRGLAGLSDLEGIPWTMPMEAFFEAWVETVLEGVARATGARMRTGRKRETVHPLDWRPPYLGTQKSLIPDLWLEWDDVTLIVDAKYKRHWEELLRHSWRDAEQEFQERHREDLLQVMAYANLARTRRVIACLTYPCSADNWLSLKDRARSFHTALVTAQPRQVEVWLTAIPFSIPAGEIAQRWVDVVRPCIQ